MVVTSPPLLHILENISSSSALSELRQFYSPAGNAASFKVFLDDACGLPTDWRTTWDKPVQWGLNLQLIPLWHYWQKDESLWSQSSLALQH